MAEIPSGSVIITPDDMWRAIETIRDTGQRTNEAVTELKLLVNPMLNDLRADVLKNGDRIAALEQQSWSSRWVPALVMSLLCTLGGGITLYIVTHAL